MPASNNGEDNDLMKQGRHFCSLLYLQNERRKVCARLLGTPEWAGRGGKDIALE